MALATLLGLLVSRRLGLRSRLMAQAESAGAVGGDVRPGARPDRADHAGLRGGDQRSCSTLRFWLAYDYPFGQAVWYGVFHAVQAFNNAGFALYPDSLMRLRRRRWICVPLALGVIAGAIGFPVLFELAREWRTPGTWSTHTRLTVFGTSLLLVVGFVVVLAFEWGNPGTLGPLGVADQGAGRVHPGRDDPLGRLQHHRPRRDEHRDASPSRTG